jgi:CheY-like chemotaxis protein
MNPGYDDVLIPPSGDENDWTPKSAGVDGPPVVILVADDDDDDRLLMVDALRAAMLLNPLQFVTDGEELMDYLYHRGKFAPPAPAPRPSLLFLDLNMPRKDGREALREIKADPELRSIIVVVLTTSESREDIGRIYNEGANSYITKPVTFEGLVKVMKAVDEYWFQLVALPEEEGK